MATTVQVRDETRRVLDKLKKEMGLRSYDEVIRKLVRSSEGLRESFFGACKGSRPFKRGPEGEHAI